ncbi:hypothetical protein PAXRUDRAFT_158673 [Paxillus rubicundulus Ve08.2h10]|uniref:Uncharacterized protein n=1 Tax=Paxillus rubicundulus Ve08.2h10 TaxID=930991 RepID=A0A0D0D9L5_9AGAM|nr:hypothetical protein PAXRUDRAFT_158673 [Paxillus rubicundulus Ve08.2h10]
MSRSNDCTAQYHPTSGHTYGLSKNMLQRIQYDKYSGNWEINMHWPFPNHGEWSLGKFLAENFMQAQINAFLKLPWVTLLTNIKSCANQSLHNHQFDGQPKSSFTSAHELLDWMDILPSGQKWQVMELEVGGYQVGKNIELIWWDGLKGIQSIFGNPIFAQNMTFNPIRVWEGNGPEYSEWFTANEAHCIQV